MKTLARRTLVTSILATMSLTAQTSRAEPQQLLVLVKELKVQQAQIADNQTKIETRIGEVAETVRVARIYTSRLGGAHKPPKPPK
jgi:hypothetical protein